MTLLEYFSIHYILKTALEYFSIHYILKTASEGHIQLLTKFLLFPVGLLNIDFVTQKRNKEHERIKLRLYVTNIQFVT